MAFLGLSGGDSGERLKDIARDLVTIEVNTIIKDNMLAGRMPTPANALLDIAFAYIRAFERMRVDISEVFDSYETAATQFGPVVKEADVPNFDRVIESASVYLRPRDAPKPRYFRLPGQPISFLGLFEFLRWAAKLARREVGARLDKEDSVLLLRIEDNSDTLRYMLQAYPSVGAKRVAMAQVRSRRDIFGDPPPRFEVDDMAALRKIWDIGTETILAQTIVQVDGDITTRIASRFREIAGGPEPARDLLALHQQGLNTALGRWKDLVEAAWAVIRGLAGVAPGK